MNLVSTDWLDENLKKVKIFDASWHMPSSRRDAKKEYKEKHIKVAMSVSYTHLTLPTKRIV